MCVCVLMVSVRNRDAEAGFTVAHRIVAVVDAIRGARSLFRSFSIVGLSRHLGLRPLRRPGLYLGSGWPGLGLDVVSRH